MKSLIAKWTDKTTVIGGVIGALTPPVVTIYCAAPPEVCVLSIFASPFYCLFGVVAGGIAGTVCGIIHGYVNGLKFNFMDYYEPNHFREPIRIVPKMFYRLGESPYIVEYPIIY
jgi:hypothetical protein